MGSGGLLNDGLMLVVFAHAGGLLSVPLGIICIAMLLNKRLGLRRVAPETIGSVDLTRKNQANARQAKAVQTFHKFSAGFARPSVLTHLVAGTVDIMLDFSVCFLLWMFYLMLVLGQVVLVSAF